MYSGLLGKYREARLRLGDGLMLTDIINFTTIEDGFRTIDILRLLYMERPLDLRNVQTSYNPRELQWTNRSFIQMLFSRSANNALLRAIFIQSSSLVPG